MSEKPCEPYIKRLDPIDEAILTYQNKMIREFYESLGERLWLSNRVPKEQMEELLKALDK